MRPTRRGLAVLCVFLLSVTAAWLFGARSLNVIAAPLLVAMVAAVYQVRRSGDVLVDRRPPEPGFVGETRTVELAVIADQPGAATVVDRVGDGLRPIGGGNRTDVVIDRTSVSYDIELVRRGVHAVGPVSVLVTDVLGLASTRYSFETTVEAIVYPTVYDLDRLEAGLGDLPGLPQATERREFDRLRAYRPGDPVRDVHWRSSAKRPEDELLVATFAAESETDDVTVVVDGARSHADELASAAASVACTLIADGVAVDLETADGSVTATATAEGRRGVLEHLARTDAGSVSRSTRDTADVLIRSQVGEVVVEIGGRSVDFDRLRGVDGRDPASGPVSGPSSPLVPDGGRPSPNCAARHDSGTMVDRRDP